MLDCAGMRVLEVFYLQYGWWMVFFLFILCTILSWLLCSQGSLRYEIIYKCNPIPWKEIPQDGPAKCFCIQYPTYTNTECQVIPVSSFPVHIKYLRIVWSQIRINPYKSLHPPWVPGCVFPSSNWCPGPCEKAQSGSF